MKMTPVPQTNPQIKTITDHGIVALSADMNSVMEALEFNAEATGSTSDADLTRITTTPGGSPMWMFETIAGPTAMPALTGIITFVRNERKYWSQPLAGENSRQPPDCASLDGVVGIGTPGGECLHCPLNQFGSEGKGKACGEY